MTGLPPEDPSPHAPPPEGEGVNPGKKTDRELVAAALRAARPRSDTPGMGDEPLPAPETFPGYEIVREIHRGGQGVVYQAIQKATKRRVALKVLHGGPFAGSKGRARFEREVAILAQLDHPNIVSILDSGTAGGQSFYVMDYVSGQTLDAWMAGDPRPVPEVLALFTKICEAVNAAHLKGITHRDVKPSNIRIDHSGEPHILDFGLAKVLAGEVTDETQPQMMSMTGQFIGSLPWASPEQAEGVPGKVDLRTDVYSLGVVLYQLLTGGKFPYEVAGNMRDVMDHILRTAPARPSTIRHQINDEVETIVLKALQKERERRYQSAGELARDIRRYLAGEPIEAMRDSGWYVIRTTLRRYKAQSVAAGVLLLLLVAFAISSNALYQRAESKRLVAEAALVARDRAVAEKEAERARAETLAASYKRVTDAGRALRRSAFVDYARRIDNLVGATGAKESLLKGAIEYLEALRAELSQEPAYLDELAEAYENVARLQSGLYLPRVGGESEGAANLRAALAIRESRLAASPDDPALNTAVARLMLQVSTAERVAQRFDEAVRLAEGALRTAERGVAAAGNASAEVRRRAEDARLDAMLTLGELSVRRARDERGRDVNRAQQLILEGEARYDEVGDVFRRRLDADPNDADAARLVVVCQDKVSQSRLMLADVLSEEAKTLARAGDPEAPRRLDDALRAYDDAASNALACRDGFERLWKQSPGARLRRDLCVANRNVGNAFTSGAIAIREFGEALGGDAGHTDDAVAMLRAAEAPLRDGLAIARELAGADRANLDAQRGEYICLNTLGNCLRELGRLEEAERVCRESLELRLKIARADRTQLHRREVGVGYAKLAQVRLAQGGAGVDEAVELYEKGMAEFDSLGAEGAFDVASPDYQEVRDQRDLAIRAKEAAGR